MTKISFSSDTNKAQAITGIRAIALILLIVSCAFTLSDLPPMFCRVYVYQAAENVAMLPGVSFSEVYQNTTLSTKSRKNYGTFSTDACRATLEFVNYFEGQTGRFITSNRDYFWDQVRKIHLEKTQNDTVTGCFIDSLVMLGSAIQQLLVKIPELKPGQQKVLNDINTRLERYKTFTDRSRSPLRELADFAVRHGLIIQGYEDPVLSPEEISARIIQLVWRNKQHKSLARQSRYYSELLGKLMQSPSVQIKSLAPETNGSNHIN